MERRRPPARQRRRGFLVVFGLLFVAVLAAAAALWLRLSGTENVVLTKDTEYVEGVAGTWQRVNPLFSSANDVDQDLAALVFSGLIRLGPTGEAQPGLAQDLPTISADGMTYTFTLRKDLKWHDGEPLTSRDVRFTVQRLKDADFRGDPNLATGWEDVEVTAPDDLTVVLKLRSRSAPFLVRNATVGLLPEHLLQGKSAGALFDDPFNAAPVGSGPYRLESLNSQEAVLRANAGYYLGDPGIDVIRLKFFADYPAALRALQGKRLDGLFLRDLAVPAMAAEIDALEDVTIEHTKGTASVIMYLNNDQVALFEDARIRRAISLAIDRKSLTEQVYRDFGEPSSSQVPPGSWAYAADYDTQRSENLTEARKLLADAGWVQHPTSGVLAREGGEFRFTIRTDTDQTRVAIANEIARDLEPLGIRATVVSTTFSVLRRDFLQERKYDAVIATWDQGPDPDPYPAWHSSQMGSAGLNLANFADAIVDELIAKARITEDQSVRKDLYRQFQEKWEELAPSVVLAYPQRAYVRSSAIKAPAVGVLFIPAQRFANIQEWKR